MICPVSLGRELGKDPDRARIVPVNAHLPVVFAVYSPNCEPMGLKLKTQRDRQTTMLDTIKQKNPLLQLLKTKQLQEQTSQLENQSISNRLPSKKI